MGSQEPLSRHEDVDLHTELTPRERVDAILESPLLSVEEAVTALDAQYRENQGTFPHVVIATTAVSSTPNGPRDAEHSAYFGPFADRRQAEAWAETRFAGLDRVPWEAAKILTAEMDAEEQDAVQRIIEGGG